MPWRGLGLLPYRGASFAATASVAGFGVLLPSSSSIETRRRPACAGVMLRGGPSTER